MNRNRINLVTIILTFFCLIIAESLNGQVRKGELLKNTHVSTIINAGEKHQYTVNLKENQFAFFKLIQQGVDVKITTYDPDRKKIENFNNQNGKYGPELITLISGKQGKYIVEVRPLDEKTSQGKYDLSIVKIEPRAITPDKQIDQLLTPWNDQEIPGTAIAVVKDGKIIFKKGYGSANMEYNIPILPSTIFHIASVSKQFTAFSILLLEKEGKLSLDDDIRKYIPEMPDFGKPVTLRQLAHHMSGLRDQWTLLAMAGWRLDDVITKDHIMKLMIKQKDLNFTPGAEYVYCNSGFTLLAEVVARVSGQSFPEFTQERIFKPLHMTNTLFYDDHEKIVKNRAYSFYQDSTGYKKSVLNYANVGATSLFTTVEDLSQWAMNFETPVIGDRDLLKKMNERGILNKGDTISYALGQDIGRYKGLKFIRHEGADAGYRAFLGRFPDQKFSVIVLSNNASFNPVGIALKITDIYLKDKFVKDPIKVLSNVPASEEKAFTVEPELLNSFTGQYHIFNKDTNGEVSKLIVNMNGQNSEAMRLQEFDAKTADLSEFAGDYFSPELGTTYTFVVEPGKLIAKHQRLSDIIMTPVQQDVFSGNQWFFGRIKFVRDDNKKITGCRVSSERVRNLRFNKM